MTGMESLGNTDLYRQMADNLVQWMSWQKMKKQAWFGAVIKL